MKMAAPPKESYDLWQNVGVFITALATLGAGLLGFRQGRRKTEAETNKLDKEALSVDAKLTEYKDAQIDKLLKRLEVVEAQNETYKKLIAGYEEEIQHLKILNTLYKTLNS